QQAQVEERLGEEAVCAGVELAQRVVAFGGEAGAVRVERGVHPPVGVSGLQRLYDLQGGGARHVVRHAGRRVPCHDQHLVHADAAELGRRLPSPRRVDVHGPQVGHRGPTTALEAAYGDGRVPGPDVEVRQVGDVHQLDPAQTAEVFELCLEGSGVAGHEFDGDAHAGKTNRR